jgi:hypothetical protein
MKYYSFLTNLSLCDVKLITFKPSKNIIHSSDINSVYSYFIEHNSEQYCLNNWAFLTPEHIQNINDLEVLKQCSNITTINEEVFLIKYEVNNIGHTFFNLLLQIYYYFIQKYNCKVVLLNKTMEINIFIKSIINLFFDNDKIILIETDKLYNFKKLNFCFSAYDNTHIGINKNINLKYIVDDNINIVDYILFDNNNKEFIQNVSIYKQQLIDKVKIKNSIDILDINKFKDINKICIIKSYNSVNENTINMNSEYSKSRSFSEEYTNFFKIMGFNIIDPSNYTCDQLYYIFNKCEIIVSSWGCISWINTNLIENENVKFLMLSHVGYTHEFKFVNPLLYFPLCNNFCLVYNLLSDFDYKSEQLLTEVLNKL